MANRGKLSDKLSDRSILFKQISNKHNWGKPPCRVLKGAMLSILQHLGANDCDLRHCADFGPVLWGVLLYFFVSEGLFGRFPCLPHVWTTSESLCLPDGLGSVVPHVSSHLWLCSVPTCPTSFWICLKLGCPKINSGRGWHQILKPSGLASGLYGYVPPFTVLSTKRDSGPWLHCNVVHVHPNSGIMYLIQCDHTSWA